MQLAYFLSIRERIYSQIVLHVTPNSVSLWIWLPSYPVCISIDAAQFMLHANEMICYNASETLFINRDRLTQHRDYDKEKQLHPRKTMGYNYSSIV